MAIHNVLIGCVCKTVLNCQLTTIKLLNIIFLKNVVNNKKTHNNSNTYVHVTSIYRGKI